MTPEDSDTLRLGIRKFRGSSLSFFISSTSSLDVCIEPISGEGRCENKPADRFVLEASSSLPSGSAGAAVCVWCVCGGGYTCVCIFSGDQTFRQNTQNASYRQTVEQPLPLSHDLLSLSHDLLPYHMTY